MKSNSLEPLKVSLHGMDERKRKKMEYYLKLACKGAAIVVADDEAHAEIVDVKLSKSKSLLEKRLAQQPSKPIIALSLNDISTRGVIYVKKPIHVTDLLVAFGVAKYVILDKIGLKRTGKLVETSLKASNTHALNETKSSHKTRLEINKVVSVFITAATQKFKAIRKLAGQQTYLPDVLHIKAPFEDIKQKIEKVLHSGKSKSIKQQKPAIDEIETRLSNVFLEGLWRRKGLITGLTCLFMIFVGIYIFQSMSIYERKAQIYEARSQIYISKDKPKLIDVNWSSPEDSLVLGKEEAQKKINEIASRQLAERVIKTLHLNTIPEFVASASHLEQAPTSKFGQERQAEKQLTHMTDYFLQNLKVTQFRNKPIINIDYKTEVPELAARIVNQLAREYLAMQQYKKIEMENKLAAQETKELPIAQDTKKIIIQQPSVNLSVLPKNVRKVNPNRGNGGNTKSNAGATGPANGKTKTAVTANAKSGTAISGKDNRIVAAPFAHEKVVTFSAGNISNVDTTKAPVNTLSNGNILQNVTNGGDFGAVISKTTAQALTTGNFTQNVANGNNLGGIISNQVTNVGINAPKSGGVNITTQVGSFSINP